MFFEPPAAGSEPARRRPPDVPAWCGPPELERGSVVAVERVVARSENVVIVLPTIRAFGTGCLFAVEVVCRQGTLSADDWWDLRASGHPGTPLRSRGGDRLPAKLLRLGVRYAGGAKATTVEDPGMAHLSSADPPAGPVLSWVPGGGGGGSPRRRSLRVRPLRAVAVAAAAGGEVHVRRGMAVRRHRSDDGRARRRGHRVGSATLGPLLAGATARPVAPDLAVRVRGFAGQVRGCRSPGGC